MRGSSVAVVVLLWPGFSVAQEVVVTSASLVPLGGIAAPIAPGSGSLFADRAGLFAHVVPRRAPVLSGSDVSGRRAALLSLIASAEAGSLGYDAVQHGARIKPRKPPSIMTIDEIYEWIRVTPRQPHAIGRYQFIPKTLRRLVTQAGLDGSTRFTPQVQDRLADLLLLEAGVAAFEGGLMDRTSFMNNLAKIWAGLPTSRGRSHYHGYAGNKAVLSWADFKAGMAAIYPEA